MEKVPVPEMHGLTFEEARHIYRLDGIVIPSVSEIMEPLTAKKYSGVSQAVLDRAAQRGTEVHAAAETYANYGFEDISDENRPYFDAFLQWWRDSHPEPVGTELKVFHRLLRYGGTVDLLAWIDGKLTLCDYKTTYKVSDMTCGVQLEAYAQALASHGVAVEDKRIIKLGKDGRYEQRTYETPDPTRWRVFGSLKVVYDYIRAEA